MMEEKQRKLQALQKDFENLQKELFSEIENENALKILKIEKMQQNFNQAEQRIKNFENQTKTLILKFVLIIILIAIINNMLR